MSKPLLLYDSSQPNILYYHYNNDYSLHILNKKHAGFCSFPKKEKLKYFPKNTVLNMANKTFRKPHISTKDATGMCLYTTHKDYNSEMQKSLSH